MSLRGSLNLPQLTEVKALQLAVPQTTATALPANDCFSPGQEDAAGLCAIQADVGNAGTVLIGDKDGQYWSLAAGVAFPFLVPISNLSLLWFKSASASQSLNVVIFK